MKIGTIAITHTPRPPGARRGRLKLHPLSVWLLFAEVVGTILWVGLHELAYHQLPAGEQDYQFDGLISHAAADILVMAGLLIIITASFVYAEAAYTPEVTDNGDPGRP